MSVTPEQIQWAAYYVNLQNQGQQLTPEQAQWAQWYRTNHPPAGVPPSGPPPGATGTGGKKDKDKGKKDKKDKDKKDKDKDKKKASGAPPPGAYGAPPGGVAPVGKALTPADQAKATPAFARLKSMDAKKNLVKAYETAVQVQTKLRTITKNPAFIVVYDLSNFGFGPHPSMIPMYQNSGYSYNEAFYKTEIPGNVAEMNYRMISWLGDLTAQFLTPLLSGFEKFYNDPTNASCLNAVITTLEVRHAAEADNTASHWEVLGNKLSYVVNCHSTEHHNKGRPIEPTAVWGTYINILEKVAGLGTPPTTVVKFTSNGDDFQEE